MRHTWSSSAASYLLTLTLAVPLYAQTPAEKEASNPCNEVEAACRNAGFVEKGSSEGKGLWSECIEPIMQGRPQSKAAKLPLPKLDSKVVAACKAKHPTYGQEGKPKSK
jgi:hypothetical protein